ncbi:MAG: hypothetical protein JW395_3662 [Nitrospira sp.]|nr:hypothetical protein [Nitrospira sp.]
MLLQGLTDGLNLHIRQPVGCSQSSKRHTRSDVVLDGFYNFSVDCLKRPLPANPGGVKLGHCIFELLVLGSRFGGRSRLHLKFLRDSLYLRGGQPVCSRQSTLRNLPLEVVLDRFLHPTLDGIEGASPVLADGVQFLHRVGVFLGFGRSLVSGFGFDLNLFCDSLYLNCGQPVGRRQMPLRNTSLEVVLNGLLDSSVNGVEGTLPTLTRRCEFLHRIVERLHVGSSLPRDCSCGSHLLDED